MSRDRWGGPKPLAPEPSKFKDHARKYITKGDRVKFHTYWGVVEKTRSGVATKYPKGYYSQAYVRFDHGIPQLRGQSAHWIDTRKLKRLPKV